MLLAPCRVCAVALSQSRELAVPPTLSRGCAYKSLHPSVFCRTDANCCLADNEVMHSVFARSSVRNLSREAALNSVCAFGDISTPAVREASSLRVLLADGCPLQRVLASVLLARWDIRPELASNGMEAVLMADEQRFDLILMGTQMGVLNGMVATKHIRKNERRYGGGGVPIVAYTSEPISASESAWAEAGFTAFLTKPCQAAEMGECLQHLCGVQPEPPH